MTADSVFWIASMTKALTATAAMQLVEQGKLQLDEPISKVLPKLAAPQVLEGFDDKGQPKLRPAKRPITLRQLPTHTAGFTYDLWDADTAQYAKFADLPGIISCKNAALKTPLAFDPGDRWEYGINIDFAGKAVEAVSGQGLNVYLREHIFQPLGMKDTNFVIGPDQKTRLVTVHARKPDGGLDPMEFGIPQEPEFFMGGGGLYGTARDYLAFLQMLMHGGEFNGARLLRPETVAEMSKNNIGDVNISRVVLKTTAPTSTPDIDMGQLFPGQDIKWGLSFLINPQEGPAGRSGGSLSWAGQYLFLGRSVEARRRRYNDAGPAFRGSSRPRPLRQVRERRVQSAVVGLSASKQSPRPLVERADANAAIQFGGLPLVALCTLATKTGAPPFLDRIADEPGGRDHQRRVLAPKFR
jgi:methyl acetate hydrolase